MTLQHTGVDLTDAADLGPDPYPAWFDHVRAALEPLRRMHRHTLRGVENLPAAGPAVVVLNHSLATYDLFLFGLAAYDATGRVPVALGDDLLFAVPGLDRLVWSLGIRPASHVHGHDLLRQGRLVGIAPGGMREALRPSTERYAVRWGKRLGFARLAVRAGVPVIPVACRAADDLYTVYDNPLTALAYRELRVPLPLVRGWGPTMLPRPVQLTHHVGAPILPASVPPTTPAAVDAEVRRVHTATTEAMTALLALP